jgi:hypothetical protein
MVMVYAVESKANVGHATCSIRSYALPFHAEMVEAIESDALAADPAV